jgi:hypothetical protein
MRDAGDIHRWRSAAFVNKRATIDIDVIWWGEKIIIPNVAVKRSTITSGKER